MKIEKLSHKTLILFSFGLLALLILGLVPSAYARGIAYSGAIPASQVVDKSILLTGDAVVLDGTVNGNVFTVGRAVSINGEVNGDLFILGGPVVVNGAVQGSLYAASQRIELGSAASIQSDMLFTGLRLTTQSGSQIGRDLYVVSLAAQFGGTVGRSTTAMIGALSILQWMSDTFNWHMVIPEAQGQLKSLPFTAEKISPLTALSGAGALVPAVFFDKPANLAGPHQQAPGGLDTVRLTEWLTALLRELAILLILGLPAILLMPIPMAWARDRLRTSPWGSLGAGLQIFIIGWVVAFIAVILVVIIAAFFYLVTLQNLGFLAGALGLLSVGLAASIFWLCIAYGSKLVVAYLAGEWLLRRFSPESAPNRFWSLLLGILLYVLLASIPYLGWVIAILATFFGLGAIWWVARLGRQAVQAAAPPGQEFRIEPE